MSALISCIGPGFVQILTDAAIYAADTGKLRSIESKVSIGQQLPVAVTGRGPSELLKMLRTKIIDAERLGSVDTVFRFAHDLVLTLKEEGLPEGSDFDLLVAGISEELGPRHMYVCTRPLPGLDAYEFTGEGSVMFAGPPADLGSAIRNGIIPDIANLRATAVLKRCGADVLELMRRTKSLPLGGQYSDFIVGGRCELTTISTIRTWTETLRVWPDEVGKQIDPFRLDGLNRQQRRAAAKGRAA